MPDSPLAGARVATRLPCEDLERARRFYRDVLGLEPAEERDGGLLYHGASGSFALFASAGRSSGESTQMAFEVDDLDAVVAALKARGLEFEEVDMPGLESRDGIVRWRATTRARAAAASGRSGSATARAT